MENEFVLKMVTENAASIRRVYNAFRTLYEVNPVTNIDEKIAGKDTLLELVVSDKNDLQKIFSHSWINIDVNLQIVIDSNNEIKNKDCCMRSFLRGAFMGGGSVADPKTSNHLEIVLDNEQNANFIISVLTMLDIVAKKMKRRNKYVIYMKDAETISNFLILIGSNRGTIAYEEARTLKNYNNYMNRKDNCETANWDKTAKAASMQQRDILDIKHAKEFEKLPVKLKQIANLRMKYPMAGLEEIGDMLAPKLSKAGVSHRFKKIHEIAEEIRNGNLPQIK
ncbi:MAG: DNA-binding protein WhiA [Clostridia bacterium]|nr:DNA-binding protein WhiA [Clostridia bacterium]